MPKIGSGASGTGKTFAVGFWDSETCDNSLASFPTGTDFSWGILSFAVDGCDDNNYVEVKITDLKANILKTFKYVTNGAKEIDLSQYTEISSTQDIRVRVEITTYI